MGIGGSTSNSNVGCAGKAGASFFFAIFLAMGLVFVVLTLREAGKDVRIMSSWRETDCVIRQSRVEESEKDDEHPYVFVVRYAYAPPAGDSAEMIGSNYERRDSGYSDYADAGRLCERYAVGAKAKCFVNPQNPSEAVLHRGAPWIGLVALFPLIFVLIGAGGIYGTWRGAKRNAVPKAITESAAKKGAGRKFTIILFAIFFVVGAILAIVFGEILVRSVQARSWPQVPCVVESSHVRSHRKDKSTTYSVDILYAYEFNGKPYKSNRYNAGIGGSSSGTDSKYETIRQFPPGKKTACYVNPADPHLAVLDNAYSWTLLFALLPLAFLIAGGWGIVWWARGLATGQPMREDAARAPAGRIASATDWKADRAATIGSSKPLPSNSAGMIRTSATSGAGMTLRPTTSPYMKLVFITIFALFWNGIISVFVYQAVKGWRSGHPDWCLTTFMIPFVLVGIGAVCGIVYTALALANPRVRVTISLETLHLGDSAEMSWEFDGRYDRISHLRITFEGVEEARYRRGTRTYTDRETFAEIAIVDTSKDLDIRRGKKPFTVPADLMHSWESTNNKIVWQVKVHGEIANWPDVKEEMAVKVEPVET